MRKTVTILLAFLLISSVGFSQEKTKVKSKEFNKTELEKMQEMALKKASKNNPAKTKDPRYSSAFFATPYVRTASLSMFYTRETFGIAPVYKQRIDRDVLFVAELGIFNAVKKSLEEYSSPVNLGNQNYFRQNAVLIPFYGGVRKGFFREGRLRNYYPYIGGGAGPVIGIGEQISGFDQRWNIMYSDYKVRFTGSAYLMAGMEFYSTNKWFVDLYLRYRHMQFSRDVGSWRNFSGLSFGFTFNRGFGGGYQLLR